MRGRTWPQQNNSAERLRQFAQKAFRKLPPPGQLVRPHVIGHAVQSLTQLFKHAGNPRRLRTATLDIGAGIDDRPQPRLDLLAEPGMNIAGLNRADKGLNIFYRFQYCFDCGFGALLWPCMGAFGSPLADTIKRLAQSRVDVGHDRAELVDRGCGMNIVEIGAKPVQRIEQSLGFKAGVAREIFA